MDTPNQLDQLDFHCEGLQNGYAATTPAGENLIHIDDADKSMYPLYCPDCGEKVQIRNFNFSDTRDHYTHKPRFSDIYKSAETELHRKCKEEICDCLMEEFPDGNWQTELTLKKDKEKGFGKVRPDISGMINGMNVVIEIQHSAINAGTIIKRMDEYRKRGWFVLWIVPLKKRLGATRFRPRLFEFVLHQMYFGKVFYWMQGFGSTVEGINFKKLRYTTEVREFHKEGEPVTVGGHKRTYSFLRRPISGGMFDLADFTFETPGQWQAPKKFKAKKNTPIIPARNIFTHKAKWWDKEPIDLENEFFELLQNAKMLEEEKEVSFSEVPVIEPNIQPIQLLDPYPVL